MGVGSGGVFLLWLKEGMGVEAREAILANLFFFVIALSVAAFINARNKLLDLSFLIRIVLYGIPGVFLGRWINSLLSPMLLRIFLGAFLVFSGILSLIITKKKSDSPKETHDALDKSKKKYYNDRES